MKGDSLKKLTETDNSTDSLEPALGFISDAKSATLPPGTSFNKLNSNALSYAKKSASNLSKVYIDALES